MTTFVHCILSFYFIVKIQVLKKPNYFKQISNSNCKQEVHGTAKYGKKIFLEKIYFVQLHDTLIQKVSRILQKCKKQSPLSVIKILISETNTVRNTTKNFIPLFLSSNVTLVPVNQQMCEIFEILRKTNQSS